MIWRVLALLLLAALPARAQTGMAGWQGELYPYTAAPYVGPGDLVPGAFVWWGVRAYNLAYATAAGGSFDWTCVNGSTFTGTVHVTITGDLNATESGTAESECGLQVISVSKIYDQTGNGVNCLQGTSADQPSYFTTGGGSVRTYNFTSNVGWCTATSPTTAQPISISLVGGVGPAFGHTTVMIGGVPALSGAININGQYPTTAACENLTVTYTPAAWNAWQCVGNGASSVFYVESSATPGNAGTTGIGTTISFLGETDGSDSQYQAIDEGGMWAEAFTPTQAALLKTNECTYWGTASYPSC